MVRVFIASGSPAELDALCSLVTAAPDYDFVGAAKKAAGLIEALIRTEPDALLMDLDNFSDDPVARVEDVMRHIPVPIVLLSSKERAEHAFECISAGALTIIKKPDLSDLRYDGGPGEALLRTLRTYSGVAVIRHVHRGQETKEIHDKNSGEVYSRIVAIASSTGGPFALRQVLSGLPVSFPVGIVVSQHITQGFTEGLVSWLDKLCEIKVKEACEGEHIRPGIAYFAPDGYHITVSKNDSISLDTEEPIGGHRPSCNKLLKSVASVYGDRAVGVILSGMGEDGAEGMKAIRRAGGRTIAQDEATCVVFGMPRAAVDNGSVRRTTPLDRIAWEIMREFR